MIDWPRLHLWFEKQGSRCLRDGDYVDIFLPGDGPEDAVWLVLKDEQAESTGVFLTLRHEAAELGAQFYRDFAEEIDSMIPG